MTAAAELAVATVAQAFLDACAWDVAVRKPGNVSLHSPGHRMQAEDFLASARACVGALVAPGRRVGERVEAAVRATRAAVGCNTNLGIVLLCAPLAAAAEPPGRLGAGPEAWRRALEAVFADLDREDAAAVFRAIVVASPGGLGAAAQQDVHQPPTLDLRAAMALAAGRDRIARQYRDGAAELLDLGLAVLARHGLEGGLGPAPAVPDAARVAAVEHLHLAWLASGPDSHIVRRHGEAAAQTVLSQAEAWLARVRPGRPLQGDPAFTAWDEALKSASINPGTSADLVVATLMLATLQGGGRWHES